MINLRCFAHIRCLCANGGVKLEDEFMKLRYEMPDSWRDVPILSGVMKSQLNDLIFSIQKYLYDDKYDNSYGVRLEFINFMMTKYPTTPILDLGRAGNGNRFDMEMYVSCVPLGPNAKVHYGVLRAQEDYRWIC